MTQFIQTLTFYEKRNEVKNEITIYKAFYYEKN